MERALSNTSWLRFVNAVSHELTDDYVVDNYTELMNILMDKAVAMRQAEQTGSIIGKLYLAKNQDEKYVLTNKKLYVFNHQHYVYNH